MKDAESPRSSTHDGEDQKLELVRKVAVTKAWKPRACLASLVTLKAERRASEHWMLIEAAIKLESESCGIITARYWLAFLRRHVRGGRLAVEKQVNHQDPLYSSVPPAKRYLYDEVLADDVNALLGARPRWGRGSSTVRLPSARQASESRAGWWDYVMDANAWWLAESISPINAAMLLSRCNPNVETVEDAETNSSDEMEPQDLRRLKNIFEGADKEPRTLKAWTAYARQRGLKIHSWINKWEAWVQEVDARQTPPEGSALVPPVTGVETVSASGGGDEAVTEAPATNQTQKSESRLAKLRELGGNARYQHGEWRFTGITALVASEKAIGNRRSDTKTVRADLKAAAQAERDAKTAGHWDRPAR